jgi:hypothetical protein
MFPARPWWIPPERFGLVSGVGYGLAIPIETSAESIDVRVSRLVKDALLLELSTTWVGRGLAGT